MSMTEKIYTFWEDKNNMPEYIKLCIESWKKFLPDYEIVILNYDNLEDYLGKNYYDKSLYENFTIAQQTQAIRAAVLEKHGGIWFDADIIVRSSDIEKFFDDSSELNIFENRIACMKAKKHSKILRKWIRNIKKRVWIYKHFFKFIFVHNPYKASKMMDWDYLSDGITKKLFKTKNKKIFNNISIKESKTYPELLWEKNSGRTIFKNNHVDLYNHFYINNNFFDFFEKNNNGLVILHNSWMPKEYKTLDRTQIFEKNNTLAKILQDL